MTSTNYFLAKNLQVLCEHEGLSKDAFGYKFGLNRGAISHYTTGKVEPKKDVLFSICDYYGISVDQIYREDISKIDLNESRAKVVMGEEATSSFKEEQAAYKEDFSTLTREEAIKKATELQEQLLKEKRKLRVLMETLDQL